MIAEAEQKIWLDGWLNPTAAARAVLGEADELALRAEIPFQGDRPPFGPEPTDSRTMSVRRGPTVVVHRRLGKPQEVVVTTIALRSKALAWGQLATPYQRGCCELVLTTQDAGDFVLGEAIASTEEAARANLSELAAALATRLGLPQEMVRQIRIDDPSESDKSSPASTTDNRVSDRFRFRLESDRWVLRDHHSRGPRESASRYFTMALIAAVAALSTGLLLAVQWLQGAALSVLLLVGSLAAVLAIATFALAEVARFARAYTAASSAVLWLADDRLVISPWVDRNGAIDIRPEGRVGAGIRTSEVHGFLPEEQGGDHVLIVDSEHGPFEIFRTKDKAELAVVEKALEEALHTIASPHQKKTALTRAREKRQVPIETS